MLRKYGWHPDLPNQNDKFYTAPMMADLPIAVDLRPTCPPVDDQGTLGSCTAHSVSGMLQQHEISKHDNAIEVPSRLYIYYNSRSLHGTVNSDSGATLRITVSSLKNYGFCDETLWPYDLKKWKNKPTANCYKQGQTHKTFTYARVAQDLIQMKTVLATGKTFVFGFVVYASFESDEVAKTAILPMPKPNEEMLGGHAVCLSSDTKIPLLNGKEMTIKELAENHKNDSFYVYSYDGEKIVPGLAHSPRKTKNSTKIIEIELDNGEKIKCTPDHKFMLRNGEYLEACNLKINDSLMPLYRKKSKTKGMKDYEMILDINNKKWNYTHRAVTSYIQKEDYKGMVIHHKDFNKYNNDPSNLILMTWEEHTKLHSKECEKLIKYAKSEKGRNKSKELMNNLWKNPEWVKSTNQKRKENGCKVSNELKKKDKCGFQAMNKERLKKITSENGKNNFKKLHSPESQQKSKNTLKEKFKNDINFQEKVKNNAIKNIQKYNQDLKNNILEITENQRNARRINAYKLCYKRFYKNKFDTFEKFLDEKFPNNHKVISIKDAGYDDVYDLTVEKYHNFAVSSGVFVHNCAVGYDDDYFIIRNSWGCYDKHTEILTSEGWKLFENIKEDEVVATLNPTSNELEYHKIIEKQKYHYEGNLYNYIGRDINLNVTPNHNMYISPFNSKRSEWIIEKAENINIKNFYIKKDAIWNGEEYENHIVGKDVISMDVWVEFLGYFLSEGHSNLNIHKRKSRNRIRKRNGIYYYSFEKEREQKNYIIGISQSKKDNVDKIQNCLNKLPWKFTRNNHTWTTNNKSLWEELSILGKASEKYIPNYIKNISSRQLKIFFDALMLGDGSGTPLKKWTYYTSSKKLADDFQEILLKIGMCGDISFSDRKGRKNKFGITRFTEYRVGIKTKETCPHIKQLPKMNYYNDNVYCVTVPNHIIYVRRNGKSCWCGNSNWGDKGYFKMPHNYILNKELATDFWMINN